MKATQDPSMRLGSRAWAAAIALSMHPALAASPPQLSVGLSGNGETVRVSWTSEALTSSAPYWHYRWQVQTSGDLDRWENSGAPISGGIKPDGAVAHEVTVPRGDGVRFVRVAYVFDAAGGDLRGANLSGEDLRGANLSGANLSGTLLRGANLTGANMAGATVGGADLEGAALAGANLDGVSLDGLPLAGLDLSGIQGTPILTYLTVANLDGPAADALPRLPYRPKAEHVVSEDPEVPGLAVSINTATLMLKDGVTSRQLNTLLARHGASIVGASPRDRTLDRGLLTARFPTTTALTLLNLTEALTQDPIIDAAAPDIYLGVDIVSDLPGMAPGWLWTGYEDPLVVDRGNWGVEWSRVPQLWNFVAAVGKSGVRRPRTGILDTEFFDHQDLLYSDRYGPVSPYNGAFVGPIPPGSTADHGVHVAGIAAAAFDNGEGIDGVNPFADVVQMALNSYPVPLWQSFALPDASAPSATSFTENIRSLLAAEPNLELLNTSLGFKWQTALATRDDAGEIIEYPDSVSVGQLARIRTVATAWGFIMSKIAASNPGVLFVTSAGNDDAIIPGEVSSPMTNAALYWQSPNILVVKAFGKNGGKATFSNNPSGTQVVSAPGVDILSASFLNGYTEKSGTSMATPFVTGVAGFLLALDPGLSPEQLIQLLNAGVTPGTPDNVDAFSSALLIDNLKGNKKMLQWLLDVDDGTTDGSLRIDPRMPAPGWDRAFAPAQGTAYNADTRGDGVIDMSDFRRWRDWLYIGEAGGEGVSPARPHALDGNSLAVKFDTNGDGFHYPGSETSIHPRGDFNGDTRQDRVSKLGVAGALEDAELTDLEVLIESGLWADQDVTDPDVLPQLIDSADIWVSAANFFAANSDLGIGSAGIGVYVSGGTTPIEVTGGAGYVAFKILGPLQPEYEFTVPTGRTYFLSSSPIDVPGAGGEQVLLRSINELPLGESRRGADLMVDLTCLQMTAKASLTSDDPADPPSSQVKNTDVGLDQVRAVAAPPAAGTSGGATAEASRDGTTLTRADAEGIYDATEGNPGTLVSEVVWRRAFVKNPRFAPPKFHIYPMQLLLGGTIPGGADLKAAAEILIEKRRGTGAWTKVVELKAEIAGSQALNNYRLVSETINDPFLALDPTATPKPLIRNGGNADAEYLQDEFSGTFPIDDVPADGSFEVRYRLKATVYGSGADNIAFAEIADPFDYGGLSFGYGSFGDLPVPQSVAAGAVTFYSRESFYYVLERLGPGGSRTPVAMALGTPGQTTLTDPAPPPGANVDSYFVRPIPLDRPRDADGDGIDDVYELRRPGFLDPFDPADAGRDRDNDGFTNLAEYQNGTDPETPDTPPTPTGLYAGILVAAEFGEDPRLVDLNGDGQTDLVSLAGPEIVTALGNPDRSFQAARRSAIDATFGSTPAAWELADFTGDGKLDAVLADTGGNRLLLVPGSGDGLFASGTTLDLGGRPVALVVKDVTGDGRPDLMAGLQQYKWRTFVALPAGGFQAAPDIDFAYVPTAGVAAQLDADAFPDLAVTLTSHQVAVFRGRGDGTFHVPGALYGTGFSPQDVAAGDVDGDGKRDLVTTNFTVSSGTRDISFFRGNGDGTFAAEVRLEVGVRSRDIELVDATGDARLDVILADSQLRGYTVLPGTPGGPGPERPVFGGSAIKALVHDWNGDGAPDLVSAAGARLLVTLADGAGGYRARADIDASDVFSYRCRDFAVVEADGDPTPEIAVLRNETRFQDTTASLAVWDSPLVSAPATTPRFTFDVSPHAVAVATGDLNGDGLADYAVASGTQPFVSGGTNELRLLFGAAGGTGVTPGATHPLPASPVRVHAGDLNADGRADLVATLESGAFVPFLSSGGGTFVAGTPVALGTTSGASLLADVNGDGRAELLAAAAPFSGAPYLKVSTRTAAGAWDELFIAPTPGDVTAVVFADIGAGAPELLAAGFDRLDAYPRAGAAFGARRTVLSGVPDFSGFRIAVLDANADGRPDLATINGIQLGEPGGTFGALQPYWLGNDPASLVTADLNGDGKPDIISLTSTGVAVLPHE